MTWTPERRSRIAGLIAGDGLIKLSVTGMSLTLSKPAYERLELIYHVLTLSEALLEANKGKYTEWDTANDPPTKLTLSLIHIGATLADCQNSACMCPAHDLLLSEIERQK